MWKPSTRLRFVCPVKPVLLYLTRPVFILRILCAAACLSVPVEADTGVADTATLRLHPMLRPSLNGRTWLSSHLKLHLVTDVTWWATDFELGGIYQTFSPDGLHFFFHFQRGRRTKLISKLISDADLRHESVQSQRRYLEMDFVFKTSLPGPNCITKKHFFFLEGRGSCFERCSSTRA